MIRPSSDICTFFILWLKFLSMTLLLKRITVSLLCAVTGFKKSFPLHSFSISLIYHLSRKFLVKNLCGIVSVLSSRIDFYSFVFLSNLYSLE